MKIWLTGGSGCGKSTAAKVFAALGYKIVDADRISKEIYLPGSAVYAALKKAFPEAFSGEDLDRRALGRIVFQNPDKLAVLNAITHPYIIGEINQQCAGHENVLIDAPLPNTFGVPCDKTVALLAPREVRIARIMARDALTFEDAANRIEAQGDDEVYTENADAVLYNDGTAEALQKIILNYLENLD